MDNWLCEAELTDDNQSKEHIIPNGIGGRLKSNKLLCKTCNTRMGDSSDASLCDDLRFYVEMFQINCERNKDLKGIVMTDTEGDEIIVREAGQKLTLFHKRKLKKYLCLPKCKANLNHY